MTEQMPDPDTYALKSARVPDIAAPDLSYQPPMPHHYRPNIGIIGAGGIVASHLDAYRTAGWNVAAICNRTIAKARSRAQEFAPSAKVTDRVEDILSDTEIDVVDITTHPEDRVHLIEAALNAGKHVLSQKPFVLDLADGERLVQLADEKGLKLAVNQNGRWAPHLAWMRQAVQQGLIGDVLSVHISIHWNHGWIAGTAFEKQDDLILSDFGIHWFDFLTSIIGNRAEHVYATKRMAHRQTAKAPLMAQALVGFEGGQASLVFDGATPFGSRDTTYIAGTKGSLMSDGPDLGSQFVTLTTAEGRARPKLQGEWFNDGFRGTMGALLVAIENNTEPLNGARKNHDSLALAFAAIQSSKTGGSVKVGVATRISLGAQQTSEKDV